MADIFISYSKLEPKPTEELAKELRMRGYTTWWDTNLLPGERFREKIQQELTAAKAVIVIWGESSVNSDWVYAEAEMAQTQRKLIMLSSAGFDVSKVPLPFNKTTHIEPVTNLAKLYASLEMLGVKPELERFECEKLEQAETHGGTKKKGSTRNHLDDRATRQLPAGLEPQSIAARRVLAVAALAVGLGGLALAIYSFRQGSTPKAPEKSPTAWHETKRSEGVSIVVGNATDGNEERRLVPGTGQVFRDCASCPTMVVLPSGSFVMGSPSNAAEESEVPQHKVTIATPFAVGKFEVTFREWDACLTDGGCRTYKPADNGWGREERPVINVSWDDAQAYVTWLKQKTGKQYHLLSEAEWEYASRGGNGSSAFWWGEKASHDFANYGADTCCSGASQGRDQWEFTAPAGQFPPNPFGLHDMQGNVWEWVEDPWHGNYLGAPADGSAWKSGGDPSRHVVRGGSWYSGPAFMRPASREMSRTSNRIYIGGFRIARSL